jgi:hypothetical protein
MVFTVIYGLGLEQIAGLFTQHHEVVVAASGLTLVVAPM